MRNNLPKVFLNDGSITDFEKPIQLGWIDTGVRPNGYTQIIKPFGTNQVIAETAGDFMVYASAIRYLADIIESKEGFVFLEGGKTWRELVEGESERMVLFSGGLQVYKRGIPGLGRDGFHLRESGKIWFAEKPRPDYSNDLRRVIFGDSKKEDVREKRIEAILRGYESQEIAEISAQRISEHESYRQGRFDVIAP